MFLTADLEKYIKLDFIEETNDYYASDPTKSVKKRHFKAKNCTQSDFGKSKKDMKNFQDWKGYSLICPDIKAEDKI